MLLVRHIGGTLHQFVHLEVWNLLATTHSIRAASFDRCLFLRKLLLGGMLDRGLLCGKLLLLTLKNLVKRVCILCRMHRVDSARTRSQRLGQCSRCILLVVGGTSRLNFFLRARF